MADNVAVVRGVYEAFAKGDPYVQNGLVKSWKVREWTTVVGPDAQVKLPDVIS